MRNHRYARSKRERAREAGRWSRWGRGSCENYSLEFGFLLRFDISPGPREGSAPPTSWRAYAPKKSLGDYPTFEAASKACEAEAKALIDVAIESNGASRDMTLVLDHWRAFQALTHKHRARRSPRRR
jgi:hypothetical protein